MTRFHTTATGAAALATLLMMSTALTPAAAQTAPPVTLDTMTINAQGGGSLTVPAPAQAREELNRTPGSVGFIDSESQKGQVSRDLRDVLKDTPGVYAQSRYGQEIRLSVRGSGLSRGFHLRGIEILQDGIPVNLADGSGDFYQIDPLALRHTEVFRGGNGLAYGSSTLGGAVNFVTPTAHTAIAPNVLRLEGGSYGTVTAGGQASRVLGDADFLVSGSIRHSDGYRDHSQGQGELFNGNVGYRFNPNVETRFYVGAYVVDQKLPGALSLSDALNRPRIATPAAIAGDQSRMTWTQRVANRTTVHLDGGQLDIDSWAIHKKLFHPIFQVIDQDGWTYGVGPRYTTNFTVGGMRDELVVGARAFAGTNKALQFVNLHGNRGAQTADTRQEARNLEAYAENRLYVVPTVALMTGAKLLRDTREFTDNRNPRRNSEKTYEGLNPKVGVLWEPHPDVQVFADVTRSLDVPDFSDLTQTQANGNPAFVPLQAQRAWTMELGTRGEKGRFAWDVTAYRSTLKGEMLQFTTNPSVPAATFNADRTVHQGIELGVKVEVARDLSGAGAGDKFTIGQLWNYSDFRFRDDRQYGNNRIAGVPTNLLRTSFSYTRPDGFYVTPTVDWVPTGAWADQANTLRVPGYTLLGVQAGVELKNGLLLFVDARNLTDKRYVSDVGTITDARRVATQVFYPGDGRSVYAGVRAAF
ncbi:TonB-dependent receptor [Azospirillum sp. TSO22-1]|uniref:TonB-dependent receptor family protein n=1 Tax=Azospirillum sp. TSO22-1 TaxID=716789 RepID=UPI000D61324B|nr:TonB-dependent receptor [Azospirillum sp. TSO22-1]PWC52710.1 TonB-dependent receptor [Azospirillum sp. TSO22-1]